MKNTIAWKGRVDLTGPVMRMSRVTLSVALSLVLLVPGCRTVEYRFLPIEPLLTTPPGPPPVAEVTPGKSEAEERAEFETATVLAEQGNAAAQIKAGEMLRDGRGTEPDVVEACKWLTLSARQGVTNAGALLDDLARQMTRQQIREAQRRAAQFTPVTSAPTKRNSPEPRD